MLGVRPGIDIPVGDGLAAGGDGGMSVAPGPFPSRLGRTGADAPADCQASRVWVLDVADLGDELVYRDDPLMPGVHGFVEPSAPMLFEQFESALLATRRTWRLP